MKGIILAGGKGTRLGYLTKVTNKCLLPVGKYPMIFWPLFKLIESGIKDIMIVSNTEHIGNFIELLKSGKDLDCDLTYKVQEEPRGIAHALSICEDFVDDHCTVILGDNIFTGKYKNQILDTKAVVNLVEVDEPERYGVAEFLDGKLIGIKEKPKEPPSNLAVTGLYVYPADVFDVIRQVKPSERGEFEITDVNNYYIKEGRMNWNFMEGSWIDAGTLESLFQANQLVGKS